MERRGRRSGAPPSHPHARHVPGHPAGALGIIHPFPTVLVSLVTVALAHLAGGSTETVALLGVAMLGFQSSIGATNDLVDRVEDLRRRARKPIPGGQISVRTATRVAVVAALVGLGLSALVGPASLLVGATGLACGLAYDLWLRPRGAEAVAYAIALPSLLIYAWWGAAGTLPPGGVALVALAALVGPCLSLANALVDVDLDRRDGSAGLVARLGQRGSILLLALLVGTTHVLAWLLWSGTARPVGATVTMLAGGIVALAGIGLSAGRGRSRRAAGWTAQALATAALGVGLLAALSVNAVA